MLALPYPADADDFQHHFLRMDKEGENSAERAKELLICLSRVEDDKSLLAHVPLPFDQLIKLKQMDQVFDKRWALP